MNKVDAILSVVCWWRPCYRNHISINTSYHVWNCFEAVEAI